LFETIHDLKAGADRLRLRPYGVVVIEDEALWGIRLRPWPKWITGAEGWFDSNLRQRAAGNRCWLFYNQPCRHRRFLALKYVVSSRAATFKTVRSSLVVLDEIARLKRTDAIVCEVRNLRISDRLLHRWGWESHLPSSRRRHFIKRFYGTYPEPQEAWSLMSPSG
jgi:hypothetical protein